MPEASRTSAEQSRLDRHDLTNCDQVIRGDPVYPRPVSPSDLWQAANALWSANKPGPDRPPIVALGDLTNSFIAFFSALTNDEAEHVLSWLELANARFANRMRARLVAETDPDRALSMLQEFDDDKAMWQNEVAVCYARQNPESALERYDALGSDADPKKLSLLFGNITKSDPDKALSLISSRAWKDVEDKQNALIGVARILMQHDWPRAIDIIKDLPKKTDDDSVRASAIRTLLENLPESVVDANRSSMLRAIAVEVMTIQDAFQRHLSYEMLLESLLDLPSIDSVLTNELFYALSSGDRDTFSLLLPQLVKVTCRSQAGMPERMEREFDRVQSLLAA